MPEPLFFCDICRVSLTNNDGIPITHKKLILPSGKVIFSCRMCGRAFDIGWKSALRMLRNGPFQRLYMRPPSSVIYPDQEQGYGDRRLRTEENDYPDGVDIEEDGFSPHDADKPTPSSNQP